MQPTHTLTTKPADISAKNSAPAVRSDAYTRGFADGQRDATARRYNDQSPWYDPRSPLRAEWRDGYNAGFDFLAERWQSATR